MCASGKKEVLDWVKDGMFRIAMRPRLSFLDVDVDVDVDVPNALWSMECNFCRFVVSSIVAPLLSLDLGGSSKS